MQYHRLNGQNVSKLRETVEDRGAWLATQSVGLHDSASQQQTKPFKQCLAHNKSLNINRLTQILCDTFSIAKKKKINHFKICQVFLTFQFLVTYIFRREGVFPFLYPSGLRNLPLSTVKLENLDVQWQGYAFYLSASTKNIQHHKTGWSQGSPYSILP